MTTRLHVPGFGIPGPTLGVAGGPVMLLPAPGLSVSPCFCVVGVSSYVLLEFLWPAAMATYTSLCSVICEPIGSSTQGSHCQWGACLAGTPQQAGLPAGQGVDQAGLAFRSEPLMHFSIGLKHMVSFKYSYLRGVLESPLRH